MRKNEPLIPEASPPIQTCLLSKPWAERLVLNNRIISGEVFLESSHGKIHLTTIWYLDPSGPTPLRHQGSHSSLTSCNTDRASLSNTTIQRSLCQRTGIFHKHSLLHGTLQRVGEDSWFLGYGLCWGRGKGGDPVLKQIGGQVPDFSATIITGWKLQIIPQVKMERPPVENRTVFFLVDSLSNYFR